MVSLHEKLSLSLQISFGNDKLKIRIRPIKNEDVLFSAGGIGEIWKASEGKRP